IHLGKCKRHMCTGCAIGVRCELFGEWRGLVCHVVSMRGVLMVAEMLRGAARLMFAISADCGPAELEYHNGHYEEEELSGHG
ncbi:hypothetical protein, partial [Pseudoduganella sp. RAF53_2]|uniref:hypothetical protein n=1 Tax=Pseudoduganella sp. RAF53_2 TaxID=3233060 RepID=UPI003F9DDB12